MTKSLISGLDDSYQSLINDLVCGLRFIDEKDNVQNIKIAIKKLRELKRQNPDILPLLIEQACEQANVAVSSAPIFMEKFISEIECRIQLFQADEDILNRQERNKRVLLLFDANDPCFDILQKRKECHKIRDKQDNAKLLVGKILAGESDEDIADFLKKTLCQFASNMTLLAGIDFSFKVKGCSVFEHVLAKQRSVIAYLLGCKYASIKNSLEDKKTLSKTLIDYMASQLQEVNCDHEAYLRLMDKYSKLDLSDEFYQACQIYLAKLTYDLIAFCNGNSAAEIPNLAEIKARCSIFEKGQEKVDDILTALSGKALQEFKECISGAQQRYAAWYHDQRSASFSFFNWIYHGSFGQDRARLFKEDVQKITDINDLLEKLATYFCDSKTRFRQNSFTAFLANELRQCRFLVNYLQLITAAKCDIGLNPATSEDGHYVNRSYFKEGVTAKDNGECMAKELREIFVPYLASKTLLNIHP